MKTPAESPLAELIPLWRTVREDGVTALITPALDYVGGLELGGVDPRFAGEGPIAALGEGLRSLVGSLEDGVVLHFLYRVEPGVEAQIREYEQTAGSAIEPVLREYVQTRADWLRQQPIRRVRVFVFFSASSKRSAAEEAQPAAFTRGMLGSRLLYTDPATLTEAAHRAHLKTLSQLRDRVVGRFAQMSLLSRELNPGDLWSLHYELLNPGRARQRGAPSMTLRADVFDRKSLSADDRALLEYTEAEQLCFEDYVEGPNHFEQGKAFRRVCTLKVLPESGTTYFGSEALLGLSTRNAEGEPRPFGYTLSVTVKVLSQQAAKRKLNVQHGLVEALRNAIPFIQSHSASRDAEDAAKSQSIAQLMAELTEMSSKLCQLSVSLLLEAPSLTALDDQTEAVHGAFSQTGNSEMVVESVAQLPAYLSMFPGGGPYQLRKKGCTSRNAADFLPVFSPWRGCDRTSSVMLTPSGDSLSLDLFDKRLSTAHHGIVVADTGSGKSVALGALTMDALASGIDAILIDNGNSWKALTELCGGTHISVNLKTSISPFVSYAEIVGPDGEIEPDSIQDVVHFLEVCVHDRDCPSFDKVEADVVSRAVRLTYLGHFRSHPTERPLISAFRDALKAYRGEHSGDRPIAEKIARRLDIYCDGLFGDFLNKPSALRFDARLLTFDLQNVSKSPTTKSVAMATIIQAITNRAAAKKRRTLVEVDEGHEHLGNDDAGEKFLGNCYRKMRKFDVAMWMISQRFSDFLNCKAGPAIVGNAPIRIFLRHGGGHDLIADYFKLSERATRAFRSLAMKPGHYSDFLMMYGPMTTTVRLALHPLAYWILTTDPDDRKLLERARERNPFHDQLELLSELGRRYPHGASRGRSAA